ncbi:hypothetical protein ACFL24_01150 [Patescibacteria group bacterium]
MIKLSNGHEFLFMAASGALGYNGKGWPWEKPLCWIGVIRPKLFTVVTKTITFDPCKGNHPLQAVRFIKGGVINALGLGNPGIKKLIPMIKNTKLDLIVSIAGNPFELIPMINELNKLNIRGIELNVSCPNTSEDITAPKFIDRIKGRCECAKYHSKHPLILKLSPAQKYLTIARVIENIGIQAITINSVPWDYLYPDQESPLKEFGGGGVSGKTIQENTWEMVYGLSQEVSIPVIGSSVWEYKDIFELLGLGAQGISFGSIFLKRPYDPTRFVTRYYRQQ